MAYINERLHEVQSWGGESELLPPADDVTFEIESVAQEVSSAKQTPQLAITARVVSAGELMGRKGKFWYIMGPKAKEASRARLKSLIEACGLNVDQQGGFDDQDLLNRQFVADIVNEPYEKTDPITGSSITKTAARIQNERPVGTAPAAKPASAAPAARPSFPQPRSGAPTLTPTAR